MKIADSITHSMGGFEIEAGEIGNASTNKYKLILPYTGALPGCLAEVTGATVEIIITVQMEYKAFLKVERAGLSKPSSFRLEATPAEIETILERVIYESHTDKRGGTELRPSFKGSGLTGYWLGFYQAMLISRQQIRKNPSLLPDEVIMSIIQGVSSDRLQEIIDKRHPPKTAKP